MAQHDMNIANQGFPAFRSDLNDALSAINSTHSGTSRPSGAVAGTIWLDTTNATTPTLKLYDGTDDISLATLDYTANSVNWLDNTVVADLINDLTPQLGGDLDANGNNILIDSGNSINDENDNEQIKFATTSSAVNELTVTNSATGNAPEISATGGDTNIDFKITPKGYGLITFNGGSKIQHIMEKATVSATAATGTINFDLKTQAVLYYTSNASANWTLNIRGDGTDSLNTIMDIGESVTLAHLVTQGGTAYYNSAVQVDGSSVTPKWQGGSAPSSGNASSIDGYTYTVVKTADATFTVFASQTQFA